MKYIVLCLCVSANILSGSYKNSCKQADVQDREAMQQPTQQALKAFVLVQSDDKKGFGEQDRPEYLKELKQKQLNEQRKKRQEERARRRRQQKERFGN